MKTGRKQISAGLWLLVIAVLLAGCSLGFQEQKPAGGVAGSFEAELHPPEMAVRGARGIGTDPLVEKVYVKVFNASNRSIYTPTTPSADDPLAVQLTKDGNVWRGSVNVTGYVEGTTVTLVAYAVDSTGKHLYSGWAQTSSGSGQVSIYAQPGWRQSYVPIPSLNWGPTGGYILYFDVANNIYYEAASLDGADGGWSTVLNHAASYTWNGKDDWEVPAEPVATGMLSFVFHNRDEFEFWGTDYWTSTAVDEGNAYKVNLSGSAPELFSVPKTSEIRYRPVRPISITPITGTIPIYADVVAGGFQSYLLKADGTLFAMGDNSQGQLGNNSTSDILTPTQIMTDVAAVASGARHTLILKTDGKLYAVGDNSRGQLGLGDKIDRLTPVQVMEGVQKIAAGAYFSIVLKTNGELWAFGENDHGQLGTTPVGDVQTPWKVEVVPADPVADISAGGFFTLIRTTTNKLYATGMNSEGELGLGDTTQRITFTEVTDTNIAGKVVGIAAGGYHSLVLLDDNTVWGTGLNDYGQLGLGAAGGQYTTWQQMTLPPKAVSSISAGDKHTMILMTDNTLYATGCNLVGQLGAQSITGLKSTPVLVLSNVSKVSAQGRTEPGLGELQRGGSHTLVIRTDDSAWAAGLNEDGQLGNGSTTNSIAFTMVAGF